MENKWNIIDGIMDKNKKEIKSITNIVINFKKK